MAVLLFYCKSILQGCSWRSHTHTQTHTYAKRGLALGAGLEHTNAPNSLERLDFLFQLLKVKSHALNALMEYKPMEWVGGEGGGGSNKYHSFSDISQNNDTCVCVVPVIVVISGLAYFEWYLRAHLQCFVYLCAEISGSRILKKDSNIFS